MGVRKNYARENKKINCVFISYFQCIFQNYIVLPNCKDGVSFLTPCRRYCPKNLMNTRIQYKAIVVFFKVSQK